MPAFVTVTVPMALQNLLVVLLAGCGWFVLARMLLRRNAAYGDVAVFGAALITLAGLSRACWTLLGATIGWEVAWLGNILFPLLCAGFICVAWALWRGLRGGQRDGDESVMAWGAPILLSVAVLGGAVLLENNYAGRGWFMTMLVTVTVANFLAVAQLIWRAWERRLPLAALLFALHIVALFTLAALSNQSGTLQFPKQLINTLSQGAFLTAAIILQKRDI